MVVPGIVREDDTVVMFRQSENKAAVSVRWNLEPGTAFRLVCRRRTSSELGGKFFLAARRGSLVARFRHHINAFFKRLKTNDRSRNEDQ